MRGEPVWIVIGKLRIVLAFCFAVLTWLCHRQVPHDHCEHSPGWISGFFLFTIIMQSPLNTDRGKLRMEKIRQLELEQLQWEQEALVMPEDLNRALFLSFESVKTEFSDLDGLSWSRYPVPLVTNPWVVEEPTPKLTCTEIDEFPTAPDSCDPRTPVHSPTFPHHHSSQRRPPPTPLSYPSSSRADMIPDTIRVSRLAQSSRSPLQPANQFLSPQYSTPYRDPLAHGTGSPYTLAHSHPPANLALACQSLRHPAYGHS